MTYGITQSKSKQTNKRPWTTQNDLKQPEKHLKPGKTTQNKQKQLKTRQKPKQAKKNSKLDLKRIKTSQMETCNELKWAKTSQNNPKQEEKQSNGKANLAKIIENKQRQPKKRKKLAKSRP